MFESIRGGVGEADERRGFGGVDYDTDEKVKGKIFKCEWVMRNEDDKPLSREKSKMRL
jgi:hypothetical protein